MRIPEPSSSKNLKAHSKTLFPITSTVPMVSKDLVTRDNSSSTQVDDDNDNENDVLLQKPQRPLSAYNLFFRYQRDRIMNNEIVAEGSITAEDVEGISDKKTYGRVKRQDRKKHGKIGFAELAKMIAKKWKVIGEEEKKLFEDRAAKERVKYVELVKAWSKKTKGVNNNNSSSSSNKTPAAAAVLEKKGDKKNYLQDSAGGCMTQVQSEIRKKNLQLQLQQQQLLQQQTPMMMPVDDYNSSAPLPYGGGHISSYNCEPPTSTSNMMQNYPNYYYMQPTMADQYHNQMMMMYPSEEISYPYMYNYNVEEEEFNADNHLMEAEGNRYGYLQHYQQQHGYYGNQNHFPTTSQDVYYYNNQRMNRMSGNPLKYGYANFHHRKNHGAHKSIRSTPPLLPYNSSNKSNNIELTRRVSHTNSMNSMHRSTSNEDEEPLPTPIDYSAEQQQQQETAACRGYNPLPIVPENELLARISNALGEEEDAYY